MTDVLLAHSFFLANDAKQVEKMRPYAPLGTLYAASLLRTNGFSVAVFDAMFADGVEAFEEALDRHQPRFVAIYEDTFNFLNKMCLDHTRREACRMSELAQQRGATVVASGSDVTDHPEVYLAHGVDYAAIGEGDLSVLELVQSLTADNHAAVDKIPGLAMADDEAPGGVRRTCARVPERRPDVFPFPAWDLLDVEAYRSAWRQAHGYFSLNLVTTRGCPFHCNWCAKPIWGQRYAMRSPANVAEEMLLVKKSLKPDRLWFADDIFGLQPRWVCEFAHEVETRGAKIPFMIQSRIDLMTDKAVRGLSRAGCMEVWMGVESGSQRILDAMDKGTKLEQIPEARERLREAGIKACFFIQFGYPGETFEDIMATVQLVRDVLPDDIGVSVSYPLAGTKFHGMVETQLGSKTRWNDSNDLAMMFQGTYETSFYRKLHGTLHRDLDLRRRLAANGGNGAGVHAEMDQLNADWLELGRLEVSSRSANPTRIEKTYDEPAAPDISKNWN